MSKVWVVTYKDYYDQNWVSSVFSTEQAAQDYIREQDNPSFYDYDSYEVNE